MNANELDSTMILFNYYRDEAIMAIPQIEEEYDENSMVETVRLYASNNDYTWMNMYEGQRPVGFIAGYASACPWNKKIISANIAFVFLLESHRTLENFKQLMSGFEEWARYVEAKEITAGDIGIDLERRERLYEHFGFKKILLMTKELNNE
jgi:hypothetical protein